MPYEHTKKKCAGCGRVIAQTRWGPQDGASAHTARFASTYMAYSDDLVAPAQAIIPREITTRATTPARSALKSGAGGPESQTETLPSAATEDCNRGVTLLD